MGAEVALPGPGARLAMEERQHVSAHIMQAAAGFVQRMGRRHLEAAGHDPDALHDRVVAAMEAAF